MASDETEITLGAGKLLGLFFLLAATCGIFFAIGYSLGKTSAREQAMNDRSAETAAVSPDNTGSKPSAVHTLSPKDGDKDAAPAKESEPDLTFYKAVRQSGDDHKEDSKLQVAKPAAESPVKKAEPSPQQGKTTPPVADPTIAAGPTGKSAGTGASPPAPPAAGTFVVQIAAVSHEEDAAALAGALRKKAYTASVVNNPGKDKLFHVVLGPYATLQDAESMKAKLEGEGYNPIIKR